MNNLYGFWKDENAGIEVKDDILVKKRKILERRAAKPNRQVRFWISRKYGLMVDGKHPRIVAVCDFIQRRTGQPIPPKKQRQQYMEDFWLSEADGEDFKFTVKPSDRKKSKEKRGGFYDTNKWTRLRYMALKEHGAACQCCGATRKDGVKMHVDHIKPRSKYPELELELTNLQVLCEPCNMGKLNIDETDWR